MRYGTQRRCLAETSAKFLQNCSRQNMESTESTEYELSEEMIVLVPKKSLVTEESSADVESLY